MDQEFERAQSGFQVLIKNVSLSNDELLDAYKYFKQATQGDCTRQKPSAFNVKEMTKWNAWNSLKGMSKIDAKEQYIKFVQKKISQAGFEMALPKEDSFQSIRSPSASSLKTPPPTKEEAVATPLAPVVNGGKHTAAPTATATITVNNISNTKPPSKEKVDKSPRKNSVREVKHRHKDRAVSIVNEFKALIEETEEDGWVFSKTSKGISIYHKQYEGYPAGAFKAISTFPGIPPIAAYASVVVAAARVKWDNIHDFNNILEVLDPNNPMCLLEYSSSRGMVMTAAREILVAANHIFEPDGSVYWVLGSVEENSYPISNGKVRAFVSPGGWYFKKIEIDGVASTRVYNISKSMPNGSLPGALLNMIKNVIPMGSADMRRFLEEKGAPPAASAVAGHLVAYDFDADTSEWTMKFVSKPFDTIHTNTKIFIHKTRYPNGVDVSLSHPSDFKLFYDPTLLSIIVEPQHESDMEVQVTIKPNLQGGEPKFTYNGGSLPLVGAPEEEVAVEKNGHNTAASGVESDKINPPVVETGSSTSTLNLVKKVDKIDHRFRHIADKAIEKGLKLTEETENDGWQVVSETNGIKISSKPTAGGQSMLKGEGVINFPPVAILATQTDNEARKFWDKLHESNSVPEILDPNENCYLLLVYTKKVFPTSSRELLVCAKDLFLEDGTVYSYGESVEDPKYPVASGCVRGNLVIAFWKIENIGTKDSPKSRVTYIAESNPNGYIPQSVLNIVSNQIPLAVANVRDYLEKHGSPPLVTLAAGILSNRSFNHSESTYSFDIVTSQKYAAEATQIYIHKKRYPGGVRLDITPPNANVSVSWNEDLQRILMRPEIPEEQNIKVKITPNNSSSFEVYFRDKLVYTEATRNSQPTESQSLPKSKQPAATAASSSSADTDSAPLGIIYKDVPRIQHRYKQMADNAINNLQNVLQNSATWSLVSEEKDVKIYAKKNPSGTDSLKGEGILDYPPLAVMATQVNNTARKLWDKLHQEGKVAEVLDPSEHCSIMLAYTKKVFPTSSRELLIVAKNEFSPDGSIFSVAQSIEDPKYPVASGCVRAHCTIAGWSIANIGTPTNPKSRVIYVSESNPGGNIPASLMKVVQNSIPLAVANVRRYLDSYGAPPFLVHSSGVVSNLAFDHDTSASSFSIITTQKYAYHTTQLYIHDKRYPGGVNVNVTPNPPTDYMRVEWNPDLQSICFHILQPEEKNFKVDIQPNESDKFVVVYNGSQIYPRTTGSEATSTLKFSVIPKVIHRYSQIADQLLNEFKKTLADPKETWNSSGTKSGVQTFTKSASDLIPILRGDTRVSDFSPIQILSCIYVYGCRRSWDSSFRLLTLVEDLGGGAFLYRLATDVNLSTMPRDLSLLVVNEITPQGNVYSVACSVEDPLIPVVDNFVRGECKMMGWYIEGTADHNPASNVTLVVQIDAKGWLPAAIQSFAGVGAVTDPTVITKIDSYLHEHYSPPFPLFINGKVKKLNYSPKDGTMVIRYKPETNDLGPSVIVVDMRSYPSGYDVHIENNMSATLKIFDSGSKIVIATKTTEEIQLAIKMGAYSQTDPVFKVQGKTLENKDVGSYAKYLKEQTDELATKENAQRILALKEDIKKLSAKLETQLKSKKVDQTINLWLIVVFFIPLLLLGYWLNRIVYP